MSTLAPNLNPPKLNYHDLRQFLDLLRKSGELKEITAPVDPELEITEICNRTVKKEGPALFFKAVKNSSIPLAINLFGSRKRMNLVLGVDSAEEVAKRIGEFLDSKPPQTFLEFPEELPKSDALIHCYK